MTTRSVRQIVPAVQTYEGAGFLVHRPFPTPELDQFDPFLLLDEMGPSDLGPGEAQGAPDHPHRGFETVTYLLSGAMEHKDSRGNQGRLRPGDVLWMTAGSGVVHSEDGRVSVRVIAGEALGARAVIDTRTPIQYLDWTLEPGGSVEQPVPPDQNAFAYVVEGRGLFGEERRPASSHEAVLFRGDGDTVAIQAAENTPVRVLLIAGVPLKEPVARYGPFVMNTRAEILQAFDR